MKRMRQVGRQAGRSLGTLSGAHANRLRDLVRHSVADGDSAAVYNQDWTGQFQGNSPLVALPESTLEVSNLLRYCHEHRIAVVPQGGNTGLVGGSLAYSGELLMSMSRMNRILDLEEESGVVTVEAGVVLEQLQQYLAPRGLVPPIDLGAKGSCQIGGVCSTNAGGLRFCRFGSLLGNVTGLEVVLANGQVLDLLNICRKDNTGYPLRQLFLGAEGTLGVITKVCMATAPLPRSVQVAFLACDSISAVCETLRLAKSEVNEILSAFELVDANALESVMHMPIMKGKETGIPMKYPYFVLIETYGSNEERDRECLEAFLVQAMEASYVADGVIAQDHKQASELWQMRELCPVAAGETGYVYKYDLSLSLKQWHAFQSDVAERLADHPHARANVWGHAIDGNIHLNVITPEKDDDVKKAIEPWVYKYIGERKGSISAEHGIGVLKAGPFRDTKSEAVRNAMAQVKEVFDPHCIMNPGKILAT